MSIERRSKAAKVRDARTLKSRDDRHPAGCKSICLGGLGLRPDRGRFRGAHPITDHRDAFVAGERSVLRAGLATARWITVDDTAAGHANQDGYTTRIGDDRFTAFRTAASKSRAAFLATLRAGHGDDVINDEALASMRGRNLAGPVIDRLAASPNKVFADSVAWQAHPTALGLDRLAVAPSPVGIATRRGPVGGSAEPRLASGTILVDRTVVHFVTTVISRRMFRSAMPILVG